MTTPADARALIANELRTLTVLRVVKYARRIDEGSDLTAMVDWTDWDEPSTGCPDGLVTCVVTLTAPGYTDPDRQSALLDQVVPEVVAVLDRRPLTRRAVTTDIDDELGRVIRITVEAR